MLLPILLGACSDYNLQKQDDTDTGSLAADSASVDTAITDTITISPANFPLGQMLASCLFEPAICPETHSDCTGGVTQAKAKIANRLVASAGELPPDQYSTAGAPTLEDILAGRVAMTVLDSVKHRTPILETDWEGNDWSDDAWVPREYQYWIAMGDQSEELAEVAPELLDYSNYDGWDAPVALPFDTIQCATASYTLYSFEENYEPVSPLIGTTIKSFLFPKNDEHPFPVILDGIHDVLDAYEPDADEGYENDNQAMCWYNMDNELPGGCGGFSVAEGDDLSEPFSETKSSYENLRDSALNVLGLTVYSDPAEETRVIYSSPIE